MKFPVLESTLKTLQPALLVIVTAMLHSCQYSERISYLNTEASVSITGMPFSIEKGVFLNQYINPSSRTTSWLLADSAFVHDHQSLNQFFSANRKEKLCILHWSQTDDPVWIGARIPGQFLWADLLMFESDTLVIKQYKPNGEVMAANELYKKELERTLLEVSVVSYP